MRLRQLPLWPCVPCRIYVLTFSDGGVVASKAELTPDVPYLEPSKDTAFASTFNGSFPLGGVPALTTANDDVTLFFMDNADANKTWSMTAFTTFNTTRESGVLTGCLLAGLHQRLCSAGTERACSPC